MRAALAVLFALALAPRVAAAPVDLAFRADGISRTLSVTEVLDVHEEPRTGPAVDRRERRETLMERIAHPAPEEHILVERLYLSRAHDRSLAVARSVIDRRGIAPPAGDGEDAGGLPQLRLILPERPIAPGGTWVFKRPPTRLFPAPLEVRFRLVEVRGPRAVIEGTCAAHIPLSGKGDALEFAWKARTEFDVAGGRVVAARVKSRLDVIHGPAHPVRRTRLQSDTLTRELPAGKR